MNHSREQLEALISAYLDSELTPEERADVEALLAGDSEARALLADLKAMRGALQSLPRAQASADMMQAIRARMERQALLGESRTAPRQPGRALSIAGRWVTAAVIVLMTSVGGYFIWSRNARESLPASNEPLAALDRETAHSPAARSRGRTDDLADAAPEPPDRTEVTTLADAHQTPTETPLRSFGLETPAAPAASPAAPGGDEVRGIDRRTGEHDRDITANRPAMAAGRELRTGEDALAFAREEKAFGLKKDPAASGGLAGLSPGEPDAAVPLTVKLNPAAETQVITLTLGDAQAKERFLQQMRSEGLQVTDLGQSSTRRPAGGVQKGIQPQVDFSLRRAPAATSPDRPARQRGQERRPVTDLLVVLPDEKAREKLLGRFDAPAAPALGYGYSKAARGATVEPDRRQETDGRLGAWSVSEPTGAGTRPALPEDSIVFKRGTAVHPASEAAVQLEKETARAPAGMGRRGSDVRDARDDGDPLAAASQPASKPTAFDSIGEVVRHWATAEASQPAEEATRVEEPAIEKYVIRLHISVRSPGSQPAVYAGESISPTSEPAEAVRFDPSVLDLRSQTKPAPAGPRPATQP